MSGDVKASVHSRLTAFNHNGCGGRFSVQYGERREAVFNLSKILDICGPERVYGSVAVSVGSGCGYACLGGGQGMN